MFNSVELALLTFIAAVGVLTVTPGVDTVTVLLSSAAGGPRAGAAAMLGISGGLLVWALGAAFGLTALLAASELAFTAVKWAGAAYLAFIGVKLMLFPRSRLQNSTEQSGYRDLIVIANAMKRGFSTNIFNPKVGIFYATVLPQFIPLGANVAAFSLLLAGLHVLLTLVWFSFLIALTAPLGRFLTRAPVVRVLDRLTGVLFIGFGVKLAIARPA